MSHQTNYIEYRIKGGDTLSTIITRTYSISMSSPTYTQKMQTLLALNPQIKNPDHIRAGDIIRMSIMPTPNHMYSSAPPPVILGPLASSPTNATLAREFTSQPFSGTSPLKPLGLCPKPDSPFLLDAVPQHYEANFWALGWLAQKVNYLTIPGGIAASTTSNLMSPGNIALLENIQDGYYRYKSGIITKGQYDYLRSTSLNTLKANIGPFNSWLFGDKTPQEVIRIARSGGVPATENITQSITRMKTLSALGTHGGYVLAGVGVAAGCVQMAMTENQQEKNEIFVETVASTTIGLLSGAVVSLFLISNPVGWGTALVLAV